MKVYFIDTDNGLALDSTKKGMITFSIGTIKKGFNTQIVEDNNIDWKLNGKGEKKLALVSGDFRKFIKEILSRIF